MTPVDRWLLQQLVPAQKQVSVCRYPALIDADTIERLDSLSQELFDSKFSGPECQEACQSIEQWAELLGCPGVYEWLKQKRVTDPDFLKMAPARDVVKAYLDEYPGLKTRSIPGRPRADGQGLTLSFLRYAVFGWALRLGLEQLQNMLNQESESAKKDSKVGKENRREVESERRRAG